MYKFMFLTFFFLSWGFWVLSDGSQFQPPAPKEQPQRILATYNAQTAATLRPSGLIAPNAISTLQQATAAIITEAAFDTTTPAAPTSGLEAYNPQTTISVVQDPVDMRKVNGNRVNMRSGPSTDFAILDQLVRGDRVKVIETTDAGWVQLRVEKTGQVGWMAERLLTTN